MHLDVVIVTHNSSAHLGEALDALPDGVDVVVVDNASSDGSVALAEVRGATVIRGATNAGFAAACNRGAARGDAKQVLFLNPDAVINEPALERLVAALDDPVVGVAAPRLVHPDGSRQRVQWPYPSAREAWGEALGLHRFRDDHCLDGFVIGACFLVRREAFEAVGGFDERFWLYGEEADLCRRIADLGWSVERVANSAATHIGGADGESSSAGDDVVAEHFIRGSEHFVAKHEGRRGLVSYRLANLTGSVVRGGLGVGARSAEHRHRAARGVRALATMPTRVALDSPATCAPGKGLVVCSLEAWDDVWRRNQFFVRELLAADPELRVLFVEPAFDVALEKRRGSARVHHAGLRPVDVDGRIVRFQPVKWLPRKVGRWADAWRDDQVLDAVRRLGFAGPRLWVNDPSYATLADRVVWPAVYDITDDWTQVGDAAEAGKAAANEARLFARCEAVSVCSPVLAESRKALRDDLVLVPNAVDAQHLLTPLPRPADLPDGPCAVYVGTLHTDRLDVDLACELAGSSADVSVVLVGPDALDAASRARLDSAGVIRLGARPYGAVPGYLQHADVIIVPHVVSAFTESLDPIKAYECLAVGTPTVATPVAGFRDRPEPIRTASRDGFVDAVRTVLVDRPEPHPQPVPSWAERSADFAEVLGGIVKTAVSDAVRQDETEAQPRKARRGGRSSSTRRLVVNARFRQRPITGVERYATELCARLPRGVPEFGPNAKLAHPPMGHVWEQTRLPMLLGHDDVLWSPCNTGPALVHGQVLTVHDLSPIEHPEWFSPRYARWLETLTRSITRRALHVLTPSEFTRDRVATICDVDPRNISVVPNGVDASFADGAAGLSAEQRAKLGIPEGPFVLALATEEPRKNLHRVIEAFQLVKERQPELDLVLAGSRGRNNIFSDSRDAEVVLAAEPVRVNYVHDDVLPYLYGSASVFVYAPHYEGFGIPPLEAAAAGTPCVLSDIPPLRELGLPAQWADPIDVEGIADAIGRACVPDADVVRAAQQIALGMSWEASADRLFEVFASLDIDVVAHHGH